MSSKYFLFVPFISSLFATYLMAADTMTLSHAYSLALKNEPKLKALYYKTEAIKEVENQSFSRLLPQVQGNGSWGYYGYDAEYLTDAANENYLSYSVSASQALYRPELLSRFNVDKTRGKSAGYEYQAQAHKLAFDVAKSYFNYTLSLKNLELTQSQYEYYKAKFTQLEEMLKVGLSTRVDVLEAKIRRDDAFSVLINEKRRLDVTKLNLEYFVGQSIEEVSLIDFNTIDLNLFVLDKAAMEAKITNNPLFQASYYAKEVAQQELLARKYGHYPTVDLSISRKGQDTSDRLSHTYDNQAVIQMNIPIYQGGGVQSRVLEGMKLLSASTQELEHTQKDNRLRFETLWAERPLLIEKIIHLRESKKSAELFVVSMEQANAAGLRSIVDLLDAKAKLYSINSDIVKSGSDLVNNHTSLLDLAGELNVEKIEEFESKVAVAAP